MKKLLILAAVGGALAAAAPAQAGGLSIKIGGQNGGIIIADGQVSRYGPSYGQGWHKTDFYQQARRGGHHGRAHNINDAQKTVRLIQRRTGSKVTDIVYRNGVYHVKGYGPKGRFNSAKADPKTGRLYDISPARGGHATPARAIPIPRLLNSIERHGFRDFDRVDLQGNVYKVRGLNPRGRAVVLTVNARSGAIQNKRFAARYNLPQAPSRKPFNHFTGNLKKQHYSHFSNAQYVGGGNDWSDHYRVRARDRRGKNVDLRVCAYSGNVLGWRYL